MEAYIEALLEEEPRFATEYLALLIVALQHEFHLDEPGHYDKAYFLDIYIGPQNKRHVVFYIGIGQSRRQITRITRVDYTLPVPAEGAVLFGGVAGEVMPSAGPTYRYITEMNVDEFMNVERVIAEDVAASGPHDQIRPWITEIARLEAVQTADKAELARLGALAAESAAVKQLRKRLNILHNALYFWKEMHPKVLEQIDRAGILLPGSASPRSPVRPLRRFQTRRRRTSNVRPQAASKSSNRARAARRTERRAAPRNAHRVAIHRREIDPVTGKRVPRRRWRVSDPRGSMREEEDQPSPMIRGARSGYEGNSNVRRPASSPPPRRNNSRGSPPPDLF